MLFKYSVYKLIIFFNMPFSFNPLPPQILKKKKTKNKKQNPEIKHTKAQRTKQPSLKSGLLPTEAKVLGAGVSIQSLVVKAGTE